MRAHINVDNCIIGSCAYNPPVTAFPLLLHTRSYAMGAVVYIWTHKGTETDKDPVGVPVANLLVCLANTVRRYSVLCFPQACASETDSL